MKKILMFLLFLNFTGYLSELTYCQNNNQAIEPDCYNKVAKHFAESDTIFYLTKTNLLDALQQINNDQSALNIYMVDNNGKVNENGVQYAAGKQSNITAQLTFIDNFLSRFAIGNDEVNTMLQLVKNNQVKIDNNLKVFTENSARNIAKKELMKILYNYILQAFPHLEMALQLIMAFSGAFM